MRSLRLGTRGSALATAQSRWVARRIEETAGVAVELEIIRTKGDEYKDRPLPEIGGKGLFTAELDRALLEGEIDLAVHSLKDLPTDVPPDLVLACVPERVDPRDVLVGPRGEDLSLESLPSGATVGTSSLRRRALTLAFRSDVEVVPMRGNLDTRLRKVDEGHCDVLVLAAAGVIRLGRRDRVGEWLERTAWLPAPGQGALAVVTRRDDRGTRAHLRALHHEPSAARVRAERTLLRALEGGCQAPIGALGLSYGPGLRLWGLVASPDGTRLVQADLTGGADEGEELGNRVADLLLKRGAADILDELERVPPPTGP